MLASVAAGRRPGLGLRPAHSVQAGHGAHHLRDRAPHMTLRVLGFTRLVGYQGLGIGVFRNQGLGIRVLRY